MWRKHMQAILVAIEKSTEPKVMSKREALGFMDLLVSEIEVRQEALSEEVLDEPSGEIEGDEELTGSADEYLNG